MLLFELHQHTAPCSACAKDPPEEIVRGLHRAGFSGVVLTDHFYHGNTGIDRTLPWEAFVRAYEEAFLKARAEGDRLGVEVLFGVEEVVDWGKEVLIYGLTPAFLYDHPEWREFPVGEEYLAHISHCVHAAGGLVYQAHPHRARPYVVKPELPLPRRYLDGLEVFNACNEPIENDQARRLARATHLPLICGSDAHTGVFPSGRSGIAVEKPISTESALKDILSSGAYRLHIPQPYRFPPTPIRL